PTALANFFLQQWNDQWSSVLSIQQQILRRAKGLLDGQRKELDYLLRSLSTLCFGLLHRQRSALLAHDQMLKNVAHNCIAHAREDLRRQKEQLNTLPMRIVQDRRKDLDALAKIVDAYSPQRTLERGYSITRLAGKAVFDPASLAKGEEITTTLAKGVVKSVVK
ncbi:MAG: exodeoxyribonuclease VII large subunit, partial [Bacteroidales bacterium]|nr:exodeoxyribonuclease VII large subunit [Bacteroidales bacterium]